jgi:hypothetical protein
MKYFLDTEFLEGTQDGGWGFRTKPTIDLISIGIVAEDGCEYYAISKDFNLKEAWNRWQQRTGEGDRNNQEPRLYWIRENVLKPIFKELVAKNHAYSNQALHRANVYIPVKDWKFTYSSIKKLLKTYGKTNKQIAEEVKEFCLEVPRIQESGNPEFYGYYSDYDSVVFRWLFGKMIDLPNGFPMFCNDLKQELDRVADIKREPTNLNREQMVETIKGTTDYPKQTNEHNALSDARWNKKLYEFLKTI